MRLFRTSIAPKTPGPVTPAIPMTESTEKAKEKIRALRALANDIAKKAVEASQWTEELGLRLELTKAAAQAGAKFRDIPKNVSSPDKSLLLRKAKSASIASDKALELARESYDVAAKISDNLSESARSAEAEALAAELLSGQKVMPVPPEAARQLLHYFYMAYFIFNRHQQKRTESINAAIKSLRNFLVSKRNSLLSGNGHQQALEEINLVLDNIPSRFEDGNNIWETILKTSNVYVRIFEEHPAEKEEQDYFNHLIDSAKKYFHEAVPLASELVIFLATERIRHIYIDMITALLSCGNFNLNAAWLKVIEEIALLQGHEKEQALLNHVGTLEPVLESSAGDSVEILEQIQNTSLAQKNAGELLECSHSFSEITWVSGIDLSQKLTEDVSNDVRLLEVLCQWANYFHKFFHVHGGPSSAGTPVPKRGTFVSELVKAHKQSFNRMNELMKGVGNEKLMPSPLPVSREKTGLPSGALGGTKQSPSPRKRFTEGNRSASFSPGSAALLRTPAVRRSNSFVVRAGSVSLNDSEVRTPSPQGLFFTPLAQGSPRPGWNSSPRIIRQKEFLLASSPMQRSPLVRAQSSPSIPKL